MGAVMHIDKQSLLKFDKPGPRYTSYPTAPEWSEDVKAEAYASRLRQFGKSEKTLSFYVHIPFCETLCYFCACTMNIRKQDEKYGDEYLEYLFKEIDLVCEHISRKKKIRQLHWGGGTPSYLNEAQIERLFGKIRDCFEIDFTGEIAIEVDPRRITRNKLQTLRQLGFNRISIGVQDFDQQVQENINRIQPFELVQAFNDWCRELKFDSVNFDLIYGLPYQTVETFQETVRRTVGLRPDRIALYSFAHVPWLKKHQDKMDREHLPGNDQKLDIFLNARALFFENGYEAIAMDHFALKNDELSRAFQAGTLHRNFMGYTVKPADEYIGVGVSAIGFLEKSYFQNYKTIPEYYRFLKQGELPIERGKILSTDDQLRQWVINALMCRFRLDKKIFAEKFGCDFDEYFSFEQDHLQYCSKEGLLTFTKNHLEVTALGKIFIRNVCLGFDWYLRQEKAHRRFSKII